MTDTTQVGNQIVSDTAINVPVPEVTDADAARTQAAVGKLIGQSEKVLNAYHGRIPSFKYLFADGVAAIFRPDMFAPHTSVFYTDNPKYIAELDKEVAANHPYIYTVPGSLQVEERMLDPVSAYREKIRRELIIEMEQKAQASATGRDMGTYASPQIRPASSNDVSAMTGQDTRVAAAVPGTLRPDQVAGITATPTAIKMLAAAGLKSGA